MDTFSLAYYVKKIIEEKYADYIKLENVDVDRMINMCGLYNRDKKINIKSEPNIEYSISPKFEKDIKIKGSQQEILNSNEFIEKYDFFIKITYAILMVDVDIFKKNKNVIIIKNMFNILKALREKRTKLINECANVTLQLIDDGINEYESYIKIFIRDIKLITKITLSIQKILDTGIMKKTDNLLTLIMPYFYDYIQYIEIYK